MYQLNHNLIVLSIFLINLTYGSLSQKIDNEFMEGKENTLRYRETKVVVIGGGAAGIAAAEYLNEQGIDFLLVEARTRLGGRISMAKIGGYGVEMGANWIHGQHNVDYDPMGTNQPKFTNPVWRFHKKHPKLFEGAFTDYEDELLITQNGKKVNEGRLDLAWDYLEDAIDKCKERADQIWKNYCQGRITFQMLEKQDMALKDCVYKHMPPNAPMDRVSVALRDAFSWVEDEFETGIFNCSLLNILPLNNVDRIQYNDNDWFIKNGYHKFIDTIAYGSAGMKEKIILDQPVAKITYSNQRVNVLTKDGEKKPGGLQITADYAICTIPLGVLQKGDVDFDPPFSFEKLDAIDQFNMGSYEKIYVQFPHNFWGDKEVLMSINVDRPPSESIMTWGLNLDIEKYFKGSNMLTFHSMGPTAKRIAKQDNQDTMKEVDTIMKKMFGDKAVPPLKILTSNWTYDPYSYGSWSHMPYGYSKLQWQLVRKNEGRLFFAGEHTSYNYGFVHSAYETGKEVAKQIYNDINGINTSPTEVRKFCPTNMY